MPAQTSPISRPIAIVIALYEIRAPALRLAIADVGDSPADATGWSVDSVLG
jgi:hypothetical protein